MSWITCNKCNSQLGHEHKTCICGNPLTFFKQPKLKDERLNESEAAGKEVGEASKKALQAQST